MQTYGGPGPQKLQHNRGRCGSQYRTTRTVDFTDRSSERRHRSDDEACEQPRKVRRAPTSKLESSSESVEAAWRRPPDEPLTQLPSPSSTERPWGHNTAFQADRLPRKRKAKSLDQPRPTKRTRCLSESTEVENRQISIGHWLSTLPPCCETSADLSTMNPPPTKRSRSSGSVGHRSSASGDGSDTTVSKDKKYSVYKDVNYPVVLETKGSFMRASESGMVDEDKRLCEKLLTTKSHQASAEQSMVIGV